MLLKIDTQEMEQGEEVAARLRKHRGGGIPWMTILDGDGHEIISADGPDGNIGCPIAPAEVSYFVTMIQKSALHNSTATATAIGAALEKFAISRRR